MKTSQNTTILKEWIEANCPILWSLLNSRAKKTLPQGLIEFSGGGIEIEKFEINLKRIENVIKDLKPMCDYKSLGDVYRHRLSENSGNQVFDLFIEIAVCCLLGKISDNKKLTLRPPTGKGTFSECLFKLHGFDIYAEVKNYPDLWPYPDGKSHKRSLCKSKFDEKPQNTAGPRFMDLQSKLNDVHRQLRDDSIYLLFIFEHSSTDPKRHHLAQALFGEKTDFSNGNYVLYEDGLFFKEEWRNISACCPSYDNVIDSNIVFQYFWENPRAYIGLPMIVLDEFNEMRRP
jgi:hypothetical protein